MLPSPARAQPSTVSPPSSQPRAARKARTPGRSPPSSHENPGWARIASRRIVIARLELVPRDGSTLRARLHRPGAFGVGNVVAVARVLALDDRQRCRAAPQQLAAGVADAGAARRRPRGLECGVL